MSGLPSCAGANNEHPLAAVFVIIESILRHWCGAALVRVGGEDFWHE